MRALLDVNVLLALFDAEHVHHVRAREWWQASRSPGWASCPLTQNGFLRVITGTTYANPMTMRKAVALLNTQTEIAGHEFWPDDISLTNDALFDRTRIVGPKQLTDIYLLALAVKNGGRFVTLDRGVPLAVARGAEARHLAVI